MKKFLKISGIILAVIVAVMVVVPMVLSGKIGEIVKREANAMLNAKVEFSSLDVSLFRRFPSVSVSLNDLSVVGVERFEGEKLVAAERIDVAVNLLSLFGDSFTISKVWLERPQINAIVTEDGAVNWDIVKPSDEPQSAEESPAEEPTAVAEEESSSMHLSIRSVRIIEGALSYRDLKERVEFRVAPLSIALSGDLSAEQTLLRTDLSAGGITFVSGDSSFASGLEAALQADIAADLKHNRYTLTDSRLTVNSVGALVNGWVQMEGDDLLTDITLDCSNNDFRNILSLVPAFYTKDFKRLTASGNVSLTAAVKGRLTADTYPAFDVVLTVADGAFQYADLPKGVTGIVLDMAVRNAGGSLDATTLKVSRFGASFAGQSFSATLSAATPISDLAFSATAVGKIDLGAIKDIYPLGDELSLSGLITADVAASGKMSQIEAQRFDEMQTSGRLSIEGCNLSYKSLPTIRLERAVATVSPSKATLSAFDVKVGASDLAATGSLTNYWGYLLHDTTLTGRLSVRSTLLDANELLAGLASDEEPKQVSNQESNEEQSVPTDASEQSGSAVVEVPKNLALTFDCSLDKVLYEKMVIESVKGAASMRDGVLSLDNLGMNIFRGKATASARYSTANVSAPEVSLDARFSEASFKTTFDQLEMMQSIAPIFEKIEGTYTMSLTAAMTLDEQMSPVLKSVNGKGQIRSGNFRLSNVKVLDVLAKTLNNATLNSFQTTEPTIISFTIRDGNVVTKPFDVKIAGTTLTLSGLTGLDQSIDYSVGVKLKSGVELAGKIGGTFSSPKVTLDAAKTIESALSSVGVTKQSVGEDLQKRADALIAEAEKAGKKLVDAAQTECDKLVEKAANPIAKIAAQAAGKKLVEAAEKQSAKLVEEARKKADELLKKGE
ncbi:MAG: AsmA family protein [Alistipes sp.]|nr:AsmA family protein [Alistipes sp.]